MSRAVAPVSDLECLRAHAQQEGVNLDPLVASLFLPAVNLLRTDVWISREVVETALTGACQGKPAAWRQTFLAGSESVAVYLDERNGALLTRPNAADLIHVDAITGATTYSPLGFGNLLLMLGGPLGGELQTLFSQPNTAAAIANVATNEHQQRLQLRNGNADDFNANQAQIVSQGIADPMFLVREEARHYRGTVGSMNDTLAEAGYTAVERRGSKRKFHSVAMAVNRRQKQLIDSILLANYQPGGTLAHQTPAQMRQRMQNIANASRDSYNLPRPTQARRREDAIVPRQG